MPRTRQPRTHALRRVPTAYPPSYLRTRLVPLAPHLAALTALSLASALPLPAPRRHRLERVRDGSGDALNERAQRLYFDTPGLDTLTVRALADHARRLASAGRLYLHARIRLGLDPTGRARTMLPLVPRGGYEALMTTMLAAGTALGHFRGGPVHARAYWDSLASGPLPLPEGHPLPRIHRTEAPRSLTDMARDIDDLYWADALGQSVKITRVGAPPQRRWLVSLPGTDHLTPDSTPNPADSETNIREALGVPSAIRVGLVRAIHDAMAADGVPEEGRAREPVLLCGHSQGGMVGAALASLPPEEAGVCISGLLTEGAPAGRARLRGDVVAVSVAHDQDVIPATDGTAGAPPDHRVGVHRSLTRPARNPLWHAHSSATYSETVRRMERKCAVAPYGRVGEAVGALREFLPHEGEETRVWVTCIWQDLLATHPGRTWDRFIMLDPEDHESAPEGDTDVR